MSHQLQDEGEKQQEFNGSGDREQRGPRAMGGYLVREDFEFLLGVEVVFVLVMIPGAAGKKKPPTVL